MIEKGRSNNKSIYILLAAAFVVLAGTAYGIYNCFFASEEQPKDVKPQAVGEQVKKDESAKSTQEDAKKDADVAKVNSENKQATDNQPKAETKKESAANQESQVAEKQVAAKQEVQQIKDYRIVIKKSEFKLYVLDDGKIIESFGCALGKNPGDKQKEGDMKTPNGTFKVIEVCDASYWTHDFKDGKGEIKGAYGPWFFYLDTSAKSQGKWDGIGIHGTHDPASIGTRVSEGCIRVQNENVQKLKSKYIKVGTKVTIEE